MVNRPFDPGTVQEFAKPFVKQASGFGRHRRIIQVEFPDPLFAQIRDEAVRRGWPVARMIRHLCEASINGIE